MRGSQARCGSTFTASICPPSSGNTSARRRQICAVFSRRPKHGGAILFFGEADALFGKGSEVENSHDRYANIEIDYLLQRIEGFTGLAILTTNLKSALDTAFTRRLRFVVDFPFPGTPEREAMWRRALPAEVPVEELDYGRLGRLGLTGGAIHNIALNAAFIAAQDGGVVRMPALLEATRMELRKLERPFHEAELR
jgi:SpoVK/Ycf46/Vps4 family AAA+-type ATPase